jgi:hypothetical protein
MRHHFSHRNQGMLDLCGILFVPQTFSTLADATALR